MLKTLNRTAKEAKAAEPAEEDNSIGFSWRSWCAWRAWRAWQFILLLCLTTTVGCDRDSLAQDAHALTGGDARKGAIAIRDHGCASCHTIPGIDGADSKVGPPLSGISQRTYLAGILQNTPENLVRWIQNPPKIDEKTAMPNMHLSESDARDIASYLYALR
jgi:cytochrome c2